MSIDPYQEMIAEAKKFGYSAQDLRLLMLGSRPRSTPIQSSSVSLGQPNGTVQSDDMVSDMMRMYKEATKMKMFKEMMKEDSDPSEQFKKFIEGQGSGSKFTKDDMMMIMMIKMLQGNSDNGKGGLQMSDMIGLINVMQQKGSTMEDALTFLQRLDQKKQEGIEEGKQTMQQILNQPREETFSSFVDRATMDGLKGTIQDKIKVMFSEPEKSGIVKDGQVDIGEIAKQVIKIGEKYVNKLPSAQAPPPQTTQSEPVEVEAPTTQPESNQPQEFPAVTEQIEAVQ